MAKNKNSGSSIDVMALASFALAIYSAYRNQNIINDLNQRLINLENKNLQNGKEEK